MATYSKRLLSGSTQGKGIKVAATATAGTLIHTAVAGTADMDEIWVYAYNSHTSAVVLTLEWGGASAPDDNIVLSISSKAGLVLVAPGLLLQNELVLRAFAATTNVITIHGYVNRIAA